MENEELEKETQAPAEQVTVKETEVNAAPAPKTKRETMLENLRAQYPDVEDEDELYGKAMEGYDADHERLKKTDADNAEVFAKLSEDPQIGGFVADLISGDPIQVALAKNFDDDELSLREGDEGWDSYLAAREQRKADRKAMADRDELIRKNGETSRANLEKYIKDNGLAEDDAVKTVTDFFEALKDGEISEEVIAMILKGSNHDKDVAEAAEAARIAGRNEKIEEEKYKPKGDGLPKSNAAPSNSDRPKAQNVGRIRDAFEAGGFRRLN